MTHSLTINIVFFSPLELNKVVGRELRRREGGGWYKGGGVWEGAGREGRDKMGKVNRFINYGGERPAKLGEI